MSIGRLIRRGLVGVERFHASRRRGAQTGGQHRPGRSDRRDKLDFSLGPRINAAGRVDYGIKVVELLTTQSTEVALRIAQELDAHNRERRAIEAEVLEQALAQAQARFDGGGASFAGVRRARVGTPACLGIVASRIVERFYRPTVVIGFDGGARKGSARSIRGFHMVEGFRRCADHLEKFGGHEYAGGLSIKETNSTLLPKPSNVSPAQLLTAGDLLPLLEVDARSQLFRNRAFHCCASWNLSSPLESAIPSLCS